jgi:hypothetical protein
MLISIIEKGDIRGGLKYIPAFMIATIFFYVLFMFILGLLFGNLQMMFGT